MYACTGWQSITASDWLYDGLKTYIMLCYVVAQNSVHQVPSPAVECISQGQEQRRPSAVAGWRRTPGGDPPESRGLPVYGTLGQPVRQGLPPWPLRRVVSSRPEATGRRSCAGRQPSQPAARRQYSRLTACRISRAVYTASNLSQCRSRSTRSAPRSPSGTRRARVARASAAAAAASWIRPPAATACPAGNIASELGAWTQARSGVLCRKRTVLHFVYFGSFQRLACSSGSFL